MNKQLEEIKQKIKNDEYRHLTTAYDVLRAVVRDRPNLAKKVLVIFNETIKSKKNDSESLRSAYNALDDVLWLQPKLVEKVLSTL